MFEKYHTLFRDATVRMSRPVSSKTERCLSRPTEENDARASTGEGDADDTSDDTRLVLLTRA